MWRVQEELGGAPAPGPPLTYCLLAVEDRKATMHTRCQEQVVVERVPLEPPHPALHGHVRQRLLHAPSVPEKNVLVVAKTHRPRRACRKARPRGSRGHLPEDPAHFPSRTRLLPQNPTPALWGESRPSQAPQWSTGGKEATVQEEPMCTDPRGLTFPWPRCSRNGGYSGCCTRPWSV